MRCERFALLAVLAASLQLAWACGAVPDDADRDAERSRQLDRPIRPFIFPTLANDDCARATVFTGEGTFPFDNRGASTDGPPHDSCTFFGQNQIARDLWYCWTAPCDGGVLFETCGLTSIDTKLAVYDGCTCPTGDESLIACNEDACDLQSSILFEAIAGQQYLLRLGNFAGPSGVPGTGSFSIRCVDIPINDACDDAIGPLDVPSVTAGSTEFASLEGAPACNAALTAPNVWYTVLGTGTTMTASLCNDATAYDTRISVYCGTCDDLTCVGGNDQFCGQQSQISWCSQAGATYYVLVHGFSDARGPFELELSANTQACTPGIACP